MKRAYDEITPEKCPYLPSIKRNLLDFDLERICSVSLATENVYACLTCGKFFQGRGKHTHAYTHSLQADHHLFINLFSTKVYCLPDLYEVVDSSLDDIKNALHPSFSREAVAGLDRNTAFSTDIQGVQYLPGFVGLNNLGCTDHINVVIHTLAHIPPLRDFFLLEDNYRGCTSHLVHFFGDLMRKIWSKGNFKSIIDPHNFVQEISRLSKKRFPIGKRVEVLELLSWLLNELHKGLGGTRKAGSSVIYRAFQGKVKVTTEYLYKVKSTAVPSNTSKLIGVDDEVEYFVDEAKTTVQVVPFLFLSFDVPPCPLFKDDAGDVVIPQLPLFDLLKKFDGKTTWDYLKGEQRFRKQYRLVQLPPYVIFQIKRFAKNNWFVEKNPSIINFPVKNLELSPYLETPEDMRLPTVEEVPKLPTKELKKWCLVLNISAADVVERLELVRRVVAAVEAGRSPSKYNLVANVCHDLPADKETKKARKVSPVELGTYRAHVPNRGSEQWYEIEDLHVRETMPQLIGVSESSMMVYERQMVRVEEEMDVEEEATA